MIRNFLIGFFVALVVLATLIKFRANRATDAAQRAIVERAAAMEKAHSAVIAEPKPLAADSPALPITK